MKRKALANAVGRCLPLCKASLAAIDLIHDSDGELVVRVNGNDGAEIEDRIDIGGSQFALSLDGSLLVATLDSFSAETIEIGLVRARRRRALRRAGQGSPAGDRHADARHRHASDWPVGELPGSAGGMTKEEAKMERFKDTIEGFGHPNAGPHERAVWAWNIRCPGPSAHRTSNSRIGH